MLVRRGNRVEIVPALNPDCHSPVVAELTVVNLHRLLSRLPLCPSVSLWFNPTVTPESAPA